MACAKLWAISGEYQKNKKNSTSLWKTALAMVVFHFLARRNGSSTVFANGKQNSPTIRFVQISNVPFTKAPAKRSQHANATYRNIVGRSMLLAFGHPVETCWALVAQIWPSSNLSQQHPTFRNTSQHGGQTHATWSCAQQYCDMLRCRGSIVSLGLKMALKNCKWLEYFPLENFGRQF